MFQKLTTQDTRKIFDPIRSKNFGPEMSEKISTRNVRENFDPKCSKKFRSEIFEKFPTWNVRVIYPKCTKKISAQVRKIFEPRCSQSFDPKIFRPLCRGTVVAGPWTTAGTTWSISLCALTEKKTFLIVHCRDVPSGAYSASSFAPSFF